MTRRRKIGIATAAGAVLLAAAGLGAAGGIAATGLFSPGEDGQAVIDDAAAQLGVDPDELSDALRQALERRIDEALDDGRLTEEQADRLKERLESSEMPFLFGLRGPRGHGFGFHGRGGGAGILEQAAAYLGMTEDDLRDALRDSTLAEIAERRGKSASGLVAALVAAQTKRIGEAVDEGKLTDEQATRLQDGLEERTEALVNGEFRRPDRGGHRFWHGSSSPRGPPALDGPRA